MKKTGKVQLLAATLGVMAAVTGIVFINNPGQVKATAEETATFAMTKGAAVRAVKDEAGIRWETTVNKAWYDEVVSELEEGKTITNYSFGTWVTSANNVSSITELDENFTNEVKDLPCKVTPNFADETTFTYYSSIVYTAKDLADYTDEEVKKAYAAELIARSYMKYSTDNGETYTYVYADSNDNARCMRAVALAAYEETDPEKKLTDTQKEVADDYFVKPENDEVDTVDFGGYYETVNPETVTGDYTVAYNGAKKVGAVQAGVLTLNSGLTLGENYTLTLFDASGNYAKTTQFQYVTQTLDDKAEFVSVIHPSAATTLTGYYVMTTDVDVSSSVAWTATATLNGTLDGGNHKLSGLNFVQGSGIFANVTDATMTTAVKNINITDAILFRQSGVILAQTKGNVTVENVYISLGAQKFGERRENYVANASKVGITNSQTDIAGIGVNVDYFEYKAGVVYSANGDNSTVTVKNSVIYMPEFVAKANGFVTAYMPTNKIVVDVDDCTFIGGNGRVWGYVYNQGTCSTNNTIVCGAVEAHKTHKANWTDMQKAAYDANHPYVELNSGNIKESLEKASNQIFALTQDIDATQTAINTNYHKTNVFTGVFDGQGHTVSNLKASNWTRGLFLCGVLKGSCKNVAFTNVQWSYYTGGIIALSVVDGYVGNVYIEQTDSTGERGAHGAIAEATEGLSMENVVVYTKNGGGTASTTTSGFFAHEMGKTTYNIMNNCYYISYDENNYFAQPVYKKSEIAGVKNDDWTKNNTITAEQLAKQETFFGIQSFKGENAKTNFDNEVNAVESTVKLNDMLKGWIYNE